MGLSVVVWTEPGTREPWNPRRVGISSGLPALGACKLLGWVAYLTLTSENRFARRTDPSSTSPETSMLQTRSHRICSIRKTFLDDAPVGPRFHPVAGLRRYAACAVSARPIGPRTRDRNRDGQRAGRIDGRADCRGRGPGGIPGPHARHRRQRPVPAGPRCRAACTTSTSFTTTTAGSRGA